MAEMTHAAATVMSIDRHVYYNSVTVVRLVYSVVEVVK